MTDSETYSNSRVRPIRSSVFVEKSSIAPSAYSLAPNLAQALAQVHLYREWIATASSESLDLYEVTRDPRITIIIGRDDNLPNETARKILRQLNVTLHRMSVLPYDILADRAEAQLDNLARFS